MKQRAGDLAKDIFALQAYRDARLKFTDKIIGAS